LIELNSYGRIYKYLTNNFDLEPGVIAFLYLRRWDEEKILDTWENDFSQRKAWGEGINAIKKSNPIGPHNLRFSRHVCSRVSE